MATTSIMRNGLTSPVAAAMKTGSSKSILKRPTALPLSSPRSISFSIQAQVSPRLKSPHVHFPASPALAATFSTHANAIYDRSSIVVSPNPLLLPTWGDRVFSPSVGNFKLGAAPRPFASLSYVASPLVADFEDPRSPKAQPAASKKASVRFAPFPVTPIARPPQALDKSILSYPRSPYPSAPLEESNEGDFVVGDVDAKYGRDWPESQKSAQASANSRARSLEAKGKNKKHLSLASRRTNQAFLSLSSPLTQSFSIPGSPVPESSIKRSNKPKPLDLNALESDKLSEDFWKSVSLQPSSTSANSLEVDEPMVTALEYPESATMYEATQDANMRSATAPTFLFAGADGIPLAPSNAKPTGAASYTNTDVCWSPGLPRPGMAATKIRESLMSPSVKRTSFGARSIARKEITAPSPNDPFAAFPSFAAVLGGEAITYPATAVSRG